MGIDLMASRRRIILNSPHLATPTPANPVSFSATLAAPLKGLECAFSPVQAGSGDPSPSNVRPISGWTGMTLHRTGKNLYHYDDNNVSTCTMSTGTTRGVYHTGVRGGTYTFTASLVGDSVTTSNVNISAYKGGIATIQNGFLAPGGITTRTVTFADDEEVVFTTASESDSSVSLNLPKYNIQIELGSTATSYTPYTGQTLAVAFPAEAGTIYGGYIDPVRGVARAEWKCANMGNLSWSRYVGTTYAFFYVVIADKASGDGACSCYKHVSSMSNNDDCYLWNGTQIRVRDDSYSDADGFTEAMAGQQLVYELATPITYALTPAQLKTLKGANVIYTSLNGNVTPIYWTN